MALWDKLKSAIGVQSQSVTAPLLSFAVIPAAKLSQEEFPFNNWCPKDVQVAPDMVGNFKGTVWLYQMFVFNLFVEAKLGADVAIEVLKNQESFLDALAPTSGQQMRGGVERIAHVMSSTSERGFELDVDGRKVPFPAEYAVVYAMLPDITWDEATQLAKCLEHGKHTARHAFEAFVSGVSMNGSNVVFDPSSISRIVNDGTPS